MTEYPHHMPDDHTITDGEFGRWLFFRLEMKIDYFSSFFQQMCFRHSDGDSTVRGLTSPLFHRLKCLNVCRQLFAFAFRIFCIVATSSSSPPPGSLCDEKQLCVLNLQWCFSMLLNTCTVAFVRLSSHVSPHIEFKDIVEANMQAISGAAIKQLTHSPNKYQPYSDDCYRKARITKGNPMTAQTHINIQNYRFLSTFTHSFFVYGTHWRGDITERQSIDEELMERGRAA